jgi:hypothetical protein
MAGIGFDFDGSGGLSRAKRSPGDQLLIALRAIQLSELQGIEK